MPPHRRLIMPPQRRLSSIGMHRLHLLNAAAQRRQVNLQPSVLEDYIIDETVDPLVQEQWHYDQWPTVYDAFYRRLGPRAREYLDHAGHQHLHFARNINGEIDEVLPTTGHEGAFLAFRLAVLADRHQRRMARADHAIAVSGAHPDVIITLLDESIDADLDTARVSGLFREVAAQAGYSGINPSPPNLNDQMVECWPRPVPTSLSIMSFSDASDDLESCGTVEDPDAEVAAGLAALDARMQRESADFNRRLARVEGWLRDYQEALHAAQEAGERINERVNSFLVAAADV
ncbi:hypothetical protein GGX14DRAFT_560679 [Mycena pura]|uniref:Uncharacterized protein n=1 Tax=Mycena pura TaxID=153505 RepID=A0AAD6VWG9_9AGAR|nr:hypothetical protein GGX14DRAFT_560679 [Mycena pura]